MLGHFHLFAHVLGSCHTGPTWAHLPATSQPPSFWQIATCLQNETAHEGIFWTIWGDYRVVIQRNKGRQIAPENSPEHSANSLSHSYFVVPFLSPKSGLAPGWRKNKELEKKQGKVRAACLQNETAHEKLLNRYEKGFVGVPQMGV